MLVCSTATLQLVQRCYHADNCHPLETEVVFLLQFYLPYFVAEARSADLELLSLPSTFRKYFWTCYRYLILNINASSSDNVIPLRLLPFFINSAMSSKSSKEQQVQCSRSSSTNKVSKPIAMLQRRQTHAGHNSVKGKLFCFINIMLQTLVSPRFL